MPANSRDSAKPAKVTNLRARKLIKGRSADRVTRSDFGNLQTRPSSPRKGALAGTEQRTDSGAPDDVDLPALPSSNNKTPR